MLTNSSYRRRFWVTMLTLVWISLLIAPIPVVQGAWVEKEASPPPSTETLQRTSVEQINQSVSKLTDKETRLMLIQELEKAIPSVEAEDAGWMERLQDYSLFLRNRLIEIGRHVPLFFTDIDKAMGKLTDGESAGKLLLLLILIFGLSFMAEWFWLRLGERARVLYEAAPAMQGLNRFIVGVLRLMPEFLGVVIFILVGGLLFVFIMMPLFDARGGRQLFVALMLAFVLVRLVNLLSRLILVRKKAHLRLIAVSDETARYLHRVSTQLIGYIGLVNIFFLLLNMLEVPSDSQLFILLILSVPFMTLFTYYAWHSC